MMTELAVREPQELDLNLSLEELAAVANARHREVVAAARSALTSAVETGEILMEVRRREGDRGWVPWVKEHFEASLVTAQIYVRVAFYQSSLGDVRTLTEAYEALKGLPPVRLGGPPPNPLSDEAVALRSEGLSYRKIAERLGTDSRTAHRLVNGTKLSEDQRIRRRKADRERERAQRALAKQERDSAVRRAVKKAGAATAEAWAMAERMQDVLAQAHREATDPECRAALDRAGQHYRKMRDEIVKALGVE